MQFTLEGNRLPLWFWISSLGFVLINAILVAFEFYYLPVISAALMFFFLAFVRLDWVVLTVVFFSPISLQLSYLIENSTVDLYLPTEPLLALILLIYLLRYLKGYRTDLKILRHPVTLSIYFYLGWMFITILASTDPLVSLKFFLSRVWYIVGFYLVAVELFRDKVHIKRYIWFYLASFTLVIVYTIARHSAYGLDNQMMAHSMMQPFFKDHTSYGATLAFLLPVILGFITVVKKGDWNSRLLLILLLAIYITATVFSYTRAAWVSLTGGFIIWAVIKLRIRFEFLAIIGAGMIILFFLFKSTIILQLEDNSQKSSGDFTEHLKSISNISNDQSNLERINRWSCAIRMWKERPVFGFGPGTYQFEYGRFQRSFQRTEISTNSGNRGTAHSEYLGPLSETGLPGMISVFIIIVSTIVTGLRVHLKGRTRFVRLFSLSILIGLTTYYIHGVLNNFLDTDNASALFWGYTAILVAMDIYHKGEKEEESNGD